MGRYQKEVYCFITDENKKYYRAQQQADGSYAVSKNAQPYPIEYNPSNLLNSPVEFATNKQVFGLLRSITEPLDFIKDGAAILRNLYFLGKGAEQLAYLIVIEWNGVKNLYELSFKGKFDFSEKKEDPKAGIFTVPIVDDTAWGVLSRTKDVTYSLECNASDPKAVKVLIDGVTLLNKYSFQTVLSTIVPTFQPPGFAHLIPLALINQDGDSVGIITKNQEGQQINIGSNLNPQDPPPYYNTPPEGAYFFKTLFPITGVNISGSFKFGWTQREPRFKLDFFRVFFMTNYGQRRIIFATTTMITNQNYSVDFNVNFDLRADEFISFIAHFPLQYTADPRVIITVTNIAVKTKTTTQPKVVFAKRPLNLLQEIVSNATNDRYSMSSNYFSFNNKSVILSGDAIRGLNNAKMFTSFNDFFQTFDALQYMALKSVNGNLSIEKATEVYKTNSVQPTIFRIDIITSFAVYIDIVTTDNLGITSGDTVSIIFNGGAYTGTFVVNSVGVGFSNIVLLTTNIMQYPPQGTYNNSTIALNGVVIGKVSNIIEIVDIGEAIDVKLSPAKEYFANEIEIGSPKQDLRHPSGRLEFNSTNSFSLPVLNSSAKIEKITKYRTGCFEIIFLLLDYQNESTIDNQGDKNNYLLEITDELGSANEEVETFQEINIDNVLLQPIIRSPFNNDIITNDKPTITGICVPNSNVNIYADQVLDGFVVADANGRWSYNIQTSLSQYVLGGATGIHIIQATYTDLNAPNSSETINLFTGVTDTLITYPTANDNLYNNKPLIKGTAQAGTVVNVLLNNISIGNATADGSCKWQIQSPVIPQGSNLLVAGQSSFNFNVDSHTQYPLITYVDGELDGFVINNNLPLVKGVGIPGVIVTLYLNYITYTNLGSALIDANGNWQIQVVPTQYLDPLSNSPVVVAPIRQGLSILSTSLTNQIVLVSVTGYKLKRPPFTSITGVTDNTVFNVGYSPKRMLMNFYPMLSAMLRQQPNDKVLFQKAGQNGALVTTIDGVTIAENNDVNVSSLGKPIALLENIELTVAAYETFAKTFYSFANGGIIKASFKGADLYALPIGNMKMDNIKSSVQNWSLLLAPINSYQTLLNLYKNGLTIKLMQNAIYHSDLNTLHFVEYDFQDNPKYNFKSIYQDWFENRNSAWVLNPDYTQKLQRNDFFYDQIIVNGVSNIEIGLFRCSDAEKIATIQYTPVVPVPIVLPEVVLQASIDMLSYPEDTYFFVMYVNEEAVSISEKIETRDKWDRTILIESRNSLNKVGFFYSAGIKTILRVEGLVKKIQPDVNTIGARSESGDSNLLYSMIARKRVVRFGTAYGLPDYLYLKVAEALVLDDLMIEGVNYTIQDEEKINPSDDVDGHPLYYYNVNLLLSLNAKGVVIGGGNGVVTDRTGVVLVVDGEAVGLPAGSLVNINVETP